MDPVLVFIDTEFTALPEPGQPDLKLMSIALVPSNGMQEFYAEIQGGGEGGWEYNDCSEFVKREVIPHLIGGVFSVKRDDLRELLSTWFSSIPESCQIAADSAIDFALLQQVMIDYWPPNLQTHFFNLREIAITEVFNQCTREYYSSDRPAHNALHDAHANYLGWQAYCRARTARGSNFQQQKGSGY
jgi:hypothetical protein